MTKTLFYPVGNSDVAVNNCARFDNFYKTTGEITLLLNKELKVCQNRGAKIKRNRQGYDFHFVTEKIKIIKGAETLSEAIKTMKFPVFAPLMEYLKDKGVDKLYLFATKQESGNPQDTIHVASMIKIYAVEKYKIKNVEIISITQNPSDYDLMAQFFAEFFREKQSEIKNNIENFIAIGPGTPATTTAIALNSIDLPVKYFYIQRDSKIQEVKIFHQINLERYISIIEPLISNYEYSLAAEIVRKSPLRSNFQLLTLIEIMANRALFNFKQAMELVCYSEFKEKLIDISRLAQREEETLLLEIFTLIEVSFSKKDYLSGIAFIFNLMENIRNWLFEEFTEVKIKKVDGKFNHFNEYIEEHTELKERLKKEKIKYKNSPNRVVLLEILKYLNEKNPNNPLTNVLNFIKKIETQNQTSQYGDMSLSDLRNEGPFAHGTKGVSEELLKEVYPPYGKDGIINDIKGFLLNLCNLQNKWQNPYDLINQEIFRLMQD